MTRSTTWSRIDPPNFPGEYVNVNQAFAQGAEIVVQAKLRPRLLLNTAYTYTSSEYLDNPAPFDAVYNPGQPLLRQAETFGDRVCCRTWAIVGGRNLSGSFVGRRADSDFDSFGIDHAAGYVRVDMGGWYRDPADVTAYVNV